MRKVYALALCCACVALLAAASFAGGGKVEATNANIDATDATDDGAQDRADWRVSQPIRYEPFGVAVLVGGDALEEYPARGRVYVEAVSGEEYELRIHNPLGVRVAVALSVDGLNTIDARRTSARDASKWIVEPYSTITVTGWQMSRTRARRFYFTSERDSYANKLGRAEDLGIISAVFYRERERVVEIEPPTPRPLDEPQPREESERKSAPNSTQSQSAGAARNRAPVQSDNDDYAATGIGRSVGNDVRWVHLDLEREPAAEVTIRYEYRPALVHLGILPRPDAQSDPLRRRERARVFADPRYCPEPKTD